MISITEIPPDIYRLICSYLYFNDNQLKYVNRSTINNRDFINIDQKLIEERLLKLKKNYNSCKIATYFKNYLRRKLVFHSRSRNWFFRDLIHELYIPTYDYFNQNIHVLIPNTAEYHQPYYIYNRMICPNFDNHQNQNQNQNQKTKKNKHKHWNYKQKQKQVKDFKRKRVKKKSINHKKHKTSFRKR